MALNLIVSGSVKVTFTISQDDRSFGGAASFANPASSLLLAQTWSFDVTTTADF